jgi:hypothetical protein
MEIESLWYAAKSCACSGVNSLTTCWCSWCNPIKACRICGCTCAFGLSFEMFAATVLDCVVSWWKMFCWSLFIRKLLEVELNWRIWRRLSRRSIEVNIPQEIFDVACLPNQISD